MFKREHHIRVATILQALDAEVLNEHHCLFGGGTAMVLSHGEYRESVDIDLLVSDVSAFLNLRQLLKGPQGIGAIARRNMDLQAVRDIRSDQYGIRTMLRVADTEIKFEIVHEGRIKLETPREKDQICGIATLTLLDMATTKLLANSDRWADDSVFCRDLIDLAMLEAPRPLLRQAMKKASAAYKESALRDLEKAIENLKQRKGRLEECMEALQINEVPPAVLWKRIRSLEHVHRPSSIRS